MINTENSPRVSKHFKMMSFMFLCLHKNLYIATYYDQEELLNKRSKLLSKYRHENKFLLINYGLNN